MRLAFFWVCRSADERITRCECMEETKGPNVKMRGDYGSFIFLKPDERSDAHQSVKNILGIKGVREVMVTSGRYAFVVRSASSDTKNVRQQLVKRYGQAVALECHYCCKR